MVAHHVTDGLWLQYFQLTAEREKKRDKFVVRNDINRYAVLLVVIMLRGVQRFVFYIRIAIGRNTHNYMLDAFTLWDGDTDDIIKILVKIDVSRFVSVLGEHR